MKVGDIASIKKIFSQQEVNLFSMISLDTNKVHLDLEYAKKTIFKGRIVHGMLTASLISAVLGTKLPGVGCVYLGQTLKFIKPVYTGDMITAEVEVISKKENKNIFTLKTNCTNQNNEIVIEGEAVVLI